MKYTNPFYDPTKPHHTPKGFANRGLTISTKVTPEDRVDITVLDEHAEHIQADVKAWQKNRKSKHLPAPPADGYQEFIKKWVTEVDLSGDFDAAWWLGHASVMLRLECEYFLLDPVLTERVSPVSFWGPKRVTPTPIAPEKLPRIKVVLISHNHYDHLDKKTILAIFKASPDVTFIVPLGLKRWFLRHKISSVIELDWWASYDIGPVTITLTPAKHWSIRTLFDKNRSLWGGYTITKHKFRFYFSGDSAYTPSLNHIYDALGPFDLVCLPIGAYAPRWFMQNVHMDPQSAIKLYSYFNEPKVIPIHWGVFELGDESIDEPPEELKTAKQEAGITSSNFEPFKIGQRWKLP